MLVNFSVLTGYFPILIFLIFAIAVSCVFVILPLIFNVRTQERNKLSSYECGSQIIGKAYGIFDLRFYLVAILFIIFDIEILFLFPWAVALKSLSINGFLIAMVFLFILTLGFIYEWKKGALDWE